MACFRHNEPINIWRPSAQSNDLNFEKLLLSDNTSVRIPVSSEASTTQDTLPEDPVTGSLQVRASETWFK